MANEQFLKPGASRIQCSVQHKIFSINDEGKRVQIGAIQSIAESQTKDTQRTFELGNPECLEVTQGLVTDINLQVSRMLLQTSTLLDQFTGQGGIQALFDSSLYFDVEDVVTIPAINVDGTVNPRKDAATEKVLKVYKDCTISSYSTTLNTTGDIRIVENSTIQVRKIDTPDN
jgi:hypothetical protein